MFILDSISLEDEVLNLVPLDQLVKIVAASSTVLQISHLHFVLDFGHVGCLLSHWFESWHTLLFLTEALVPVNVGFQDSFLLNFLKEVSRAHSHALNVASQIDSQLAQQVARELHHPLLLFFLRPCDH